MPKIIDIPKSTIENLYEQHKTLAKVAQLLGVSDDCIREKMIKYEIPYQKQIKYVCDESFFSGSSPEEMYFAGYLLADGCITCNKNGIPNRVTLSLATKDRDILEKFALAIKTDAKIKDSEVKTSKTSIIPNKNLICFNSSITVSSQQLAYNLSRFGVTPRKTYVCSIPDWIKSDPNRHHFLRGLIDGDGWVVNASNSKPTIGLCGTENVVKIAKEIINNDLNKKFGVLLQTSEHLWKICFDGNENIKNLINYLYKDANYAISLDRKRKSCDDILNYISLSQTTLKNDFKIQCVDSFLVENVYPIKFVDHNFFGPEKESERQYFWAGFMSNRIYFIKNDSLFIQYGDDRILEKVNLSGMLVSNITKNHVLNFTSFQIKHDLKRFGIEQSKNKKEYVMPDNLLNHKYLPKFILGRIIASGSILPHSKMFSLTGNLQFLHQIKNIFMQKIGLLETCGHILNEREGCKARLTYRGYSVDKIILYLTESTIR